MTIRRISPERIKEFKAEIANANVADNIGCEQIPTIRSGDYA